MKRYLEVDFRVSLSPAQSESVNPVILVRSSVMSAIAGLLWPLKVMLTLSVFRKYHRTRDATITCFGVRFEQYFDSEDTVKPRSGRVLSIAYITDLIAP